MTAIHEVFGGKVQVFRRPNSRFWQCSASVGGKQRRGSTKQESLAQAKDVAEDWYLGLKGKAQAGELKSGKTFRQAATRFIDEFEVITQGERSPRYFENHKQRIENHLMPFFWHKGAFGDHVRLDTGLPNPSDEDGARRETPCPQYASSGDGLPPPDA